MGATGTKKKRGRFENLREERKKRKGELAGPELSPKRQKIGDASKSTREGAIQDGEGDFVAFVDTTGEQLDAQNVQDVHDANGEAQDEDVFYGLLDSEEQTYYANVNAKIVSNDFEDDQEKRDFIEAVYRESEGKELKLASSQSCSRYFERIITRSTPKQLQAFFSKLLGHLTHLVQHRFGSHVCETLFIQAAEHVGNGNAETAEEAEAEADRLLTLEGLLLQAAHELLPSVGYLLTDKFASHTVRVLILILSGQSLDDASTRDLVASKKKETLDPLIQTETPTPSKKTRAVPKSFTKTLSSFVDAAVSKTDATWLRALATHPIGNPVLQLLMKLELQHSNKSQILRDPSLFHKLFPLEGIEEEGGGETAKFIIGLTYDSTGSHLVEILAQYLPGRVFKKLYRNVWKTQVARMAKNKVSGYVVMRILERISKEDLAEARQIILPELPTLLQRRRMAVIRCLVDRSAARGLDQGALAKAIKAETGENAAALLQNLLGLNQGDQEEEKKKADVHGSLLAQSMLQSSETRTLVCQSLLATDNPTLLALARDPAASRVIQSALTCADANVGFRKQLISHFYGHMVELATNPVGSYLVDALWDGTSGLHFIKERVADELAAHEAELRDSASGRKVWHNWAMDKYLRRPAEWRAFAKCQASGHKDGDETDGKANKTPFQLAQERFAQQQVRNRDRS